MSKVVLVTGGFDPLHSGHIKYFKEAKLLGDRLIVGLNSDEWLERKKGKAFMPWNERLCIVNN
jgi:D-beta-D-heptose 7-phosphate kinase/D-beta-D-heptose 1-phosphate adenosyltransferase